MPQDNPYKIALSWDWYGCPLVWRNFINSIENLISVSPEDRTDFIDEKLKAYGAYRTRLGNPLLIFNSEADMLFFKLKWS